MTPQDYLKSLKECPDGRVKVGELECDVLTAEFGVYDNWQIFVNADYDALINYLSTNDKYCFKERIQETEKKERSVFDYVPGIIRLAVRNYVHVFDTTGFGYPENDEQKKHSDRQLKNHKTTIMLYPYQEKDNPKQYRMMAQVIDELANYFIQNKMNFCLPKSIGKLHPGELERIVYYEAGGEAR